MTKNSNSVFNRYILLSYIKYIPIVWFNSNFFLFNVNMFRSATTMYFTCGYYVFDELRCLGP